MEASDSLRQLTPAESKNVDRKKCVRVQTPQGFRAQLLKKAYRQQYSAKFTDDATVMEKTGGKITLVEGHEGNVKITRKEDIL